MDSRVLATPSVTAALLRRHGIRLSKRLGQNLLVDANILGKIVEAASVSEDDVVIEIGPGIGTLTLALREAGAKVVTIETDARLLGPLGETVGGDERVAVIEGDALRIPLERVSVLGTPTKLVSNLPFNVAVPALVRFLCSLPSIGDGTVMVQHEVAGRLLAGPGGREFGAPTLKLAYLAAFRRCFDVSPNVFLPRPKVWSTVLGFERAEDRAVPWDLFSSVVSAAFRSRRKMLKNSLAAAAPVSVGTAVSEALEETGIAASARPEELSLNDYLRLCEKLQEKGVKSLRS